jgi:outer membrane protein assembly factor BamD
VRPFSIAILLVALGAAVLCGCGASTIPAVHSEAERLAVARRLMVRGQWTVAVDLLKTYIENNAGSADVDEAIYLLGQCYLRTKDWTSASIEFERLLRDYPESDSSGSASFRLGEAIFGQARPPDFDQEYTFKALTQWQGYLRSYPGHWLNGEAERKVALARRRLATKLLNTGRLYFKLKLHDPARVYFERVAREYSDLDVVGDAWLGLALIEATTGKKAQAIQRLRDIEERFPGQAIAARAAHERARLEH